MINFSLVLKKIEFQKDIKAFKCFLYSCIFNQNERINLEWKSWVSE